MKYALRLTAQQHAALHSHLFPGDGNESVALLLCGRRKGSDRHILTVRKVVAIPYNLCDRRPDRITWPTDFVDALLREAHGKGYAIVRVHSHGGDYRRFSITDDQSDKALFAAITSFLDDELPHASLIMLPDGELFGRVLGDAGEVLAPLASIMAVGDEFRIWGERHSSPGDEFTLRHAQAFGSGTTALLRTLSVAVVGCSGTGSIVVEQLARLGVGRLLLIDPDCVEEKNLNRILNTSKEDASMKRAKVDVLTSAIARMGLSQEVTPLQMNLITAEAVMRVAECDVVIGCMDGVEDRPAVISVNMFFAALVVNDFLARLHPYRNQPNSEYAYIGGNLSEMQFYPESETASCTVLARHVGKGDSVPLLERPTLS